VETGGFWFKTSLGIVNIKSYLKNKTNKSERIGAMAQVVEGLSVRP
jgi:hypothetical protein